MYVRDRDAGEVTGEYNIPSAASKTFAIVYRIGKPRDRGMPWEKKSKGKGIEIAMLGEGADHKVWGNDGNWFYVG